MSSTYEPPVLSITFEGLHDVGRDLAILAVELAAVASTHAQTADVASQARVAVLLAESVAADLMKLRALLQMLEHAEACQI